MTIHMSIKINDVDPEDLASYIWEKLVDQHDEVTVTVEGVDEED